MRTPVHGIYRSAIIDPTGTYRYWLVRRWRSGPLVVFIMLNPSTADGERDDATIRRCISFAKAWGFGGLIVVNLFAYRATNPAKLIERSARGQDIVGPDNDTYILRAASNAERVVAAWGASKCVSHRGIAVLNLLPSLPIYCLGVTRDGQPKHPVRLARSTRCELLRRSTSSFIRCPFCGGLAYPTPVKVKAGIYYMCSQCDESGPIMKTEPEAQAGWNRGHVDLEAC